MRSYIRKERNKDKRSKENNKQKLALKKIKEYIDEPISIFRRRRRFNLNDNLLVSREESERRLQLGCFSLAIVLVIACSIITFVYGLTLRVEVPTIVIPGKREDKHQCKFFDN